LISLNDIVSISVLTLILTIVSQCDDVTHYDITDKNNNISFEVIKIHYHSSSYQTHCDTSDNVPRPSKSVVILYLSSSIF